MDIRNTSLLLLLTFTIFTGYSQKKLTEKNVVGNWKLIIEIDEAMEEAEEELEEEDESILAQAILSATSGLVTGILNNIDIEISLFKDGKAQVKVDAFGEKEIEYTSWWIENGRLYIDDTDSFQSDSDYWLGKDGILISIDSEDGPNEYVYMKPLD